MEGLNPSCPKSRLAGIGLTAARRKRYHYCPRLKIQGHQSFKRLTNSISHSPGVRRPGGTQVACSRYSAPLLYLDLKGCDLGKEQKVVEHLLCFRHVARHFKHTIAFILYNPLSGKLCYANFMDEKT